MVLSSFGTARLLGIAASCAASVAVGLGLVFTLVTPESVARLGTPELLGLLGLLVMPLAVLICARAHRAAAPVARPSIIEPAPRRVVVVAPDLRDTTAKRHRRRHAMHATAKTRHGSHGLDGSIKNPI